MMKGLKNNGKERSELEADGDDDDDVYYPRGRRPSGDEINCYSSG